MDRPQLYEIPDDVACTACDARGRALVGESEERRMSRMKCRKCDSDYWENQALGTVQMEMNER